MKKKIIPVLCSLFIAAVMIGGSACGGGGGSSSNTDTSGSTGLSNIRAEAALQGAPNQPIDPLNIQAGDAVVFQVAGYDSSRARHLLPSSGWTTTDNGNVSGTVASDGTFSATAAGSTFSASGLASGTTYSENYRVKPVQALVTGLIFDSNGFSVSHVAIVFFNVGGVEVSRAVSQSDGSFRASVPTSAKTFNLDKATMPTNFYYRSFLYQTKRYSALNSACNVTLPALVNGTTTAIGNLTVDAAETNGSPNPPPPPPDGCS